MALVRDPHFWHRFSLAVHLDEEKSSTESNDSSLVSYVYYPIHSPVSY